MDLECGSTKSPSVLNSRRKSIPVGIEAGQQRVVKVHGAENERPVPCAFAIGAHHMRWDPWAEGAGRCCFAARSNQCITGTLLTRHFGHVEATAAAAALSRHARLPDHQFTSTSNLSTRFAARDRGLTHGHVTSRADGRRTRSEAQRGQVPTNDCAG